MVPKDDVNHQITIPILEKFVNIADNIGIIDESTAQYDRQNYEDALEPDNINYTGNQGEP